MFCNFPEGSSPLFFPIWFGLQQSATGQSTKENSLNIICFDSRIANHKGKLHFKTQCAFFCFALFRKNSVYAPQNRQQNSAARMLAMFRHSMYSLSESAVSGQHYTPSTINYNLTKRQLRLKKLKSTVNAAHEAVERTSAVETWPRYSPLEFVYTCLHHNNRDRKGTSILYPDPVRLSDQL